MECHLLLVAVTLLTYLLNARSSYGNVLIYSASRPPTDGGSPLQLSCTNNTWIHVTKEVYLPNCSSTSVSEKVLDSSSNELNVNCVKGETSENNTRICNETVVSKAHFERFFGPNCTDVSVNISYECVAESEIKNMGKNFFLVVPQKHLYLASPSLFNASDNCKAGCRCVANTTGIRVQVLYATAQAGLDLRCGRCKVERNISTNVQNGNVTNLFFTQTNLANTTYTLDLLLNETNKESKVWIKIEGEDNITLSCNDGIENTTTTSVSPETATTTKDTTPPPSQTTTETGSSQTSSDVSTSSSAININNSATGSSPETASTGPFDSSSKSSITTTHVISSSHGTTNTDPSETFSTTSIKPVDNTVTSSQATTSTSPSETSSTTSITPTDNKVTSLQATTSTSPSETTSTSPRLSSDNTVTSSQATTSTSPSETSSGTAAPDSNRTSSSPRTTDAHPFKVVYIYIIAGVACVLVFVCVVTGIICRRRRVKRGKIRTPTKETGRHGGDAHNDVRLPRMTSDNYWEIDLDDYSEDTRMPSFGINDSRDASNQNHAKNPIPARLNLHGKPANEQEPIPLTSFGKGEVGGTNTSEENRTGNNDYFILEPQPEDAIPVDRQGRHLHLEESGDLSRPLASQQAEDTSRLSNPYYSEIKDIDESISFPLNTVTNRDRKGPGQFSQGAGRPVSSGNYEVVDFDSDTEPGPEQNSRAKLSLLSPSAKASRHNEEAEHDQLVMVDNEAYESADKFARDRTSEAIDNGNGGEEDELMMVDNVIYESSGPRQATDQRQPGPDDRRFENNPNRATDRVEDDGEDFMVDNIIYESSGPR